MEHGGATSAGCNATLRQYRKLQSLHERQIDSIGKFLHRHARDVQQQEAKRLIDALPEKELRDMLVKHTGTMLKTVFVPSRLESKIAGRDDMLRAAFQDGPRGLAKVKGYLLQTVFAPRDLPTREQVKVKLAMAARRFSPDAAAAAAVVAMTRQPAPGEEWSPKRARAEAVAALRGYIDTMQSVGEAIARAEVVETTSRAVKEVVKPVEAQIVGYQVLSMLLPTTRDPHRARHKTIYYAKPEEGQLGYEDMPHPPYESDRDGRRMAWGCVCRLIPVLR